MLCSLRKITTLVIAIYFIVTCYFAYLLIVKNTDLSKYQDKKTGSLPVEEDEDWNPWGEELQKDNPSNVEAGGSSSKVGLKWWSNKSLDFGKHFHRTKNDKDEETDLPNFSVEIWGKAAIGLYLWEHVFNSKLEKKMDGIWSYGFKKIDNIKFKFRTGPGLIPSKAPLDVRHLVLVLNGMSQEKITFSRMWLDFLPRLPNLRNVALVVLGSERCQNDWLLPYMTTRGGRVNVTFLIYDTPWVDNRTFHQWPLGVATYRNFPRLSQDSLDLESKRPFLCNFLGTVYAKSSREKLWGILQREPLTQACHLKVRQQWQPQETKDSLESYVHILRLSDLTLSPVGMNSECYRIYEAMSLGSVPVIEDVMTTGKCGDSDRAPVLGVSAPLRLLKALNAPVIYVKDWNELPALIEKERTFSQEYKVQRRLKLVEWYENFKLHLRNQIVDVCKQFVSVK